MHAGITHTYMYNNNAGRGIIGVYWRVEALSRVTGYAPPRPRPLPPRAGRSTAVVTSLHIPYSSDVSDVGRRRRLLLLLLVGVGRHDDGSSLRLITEQQVSVALLHQLIHQRGERLVVVVGEC